MDGERWLPSGTVAFVFTDIEGSTKLFHELGDDYLGLLDEHNRIMREAITSCGGVEVKTEGDAFFVAFHEPLAAVLACLHAQSALAADRLDHPVRVRMGVHVGPVTIVDDDYVGISVHEAARIAGAAHGGQILISEDVAAAIDGRLPDGTGIRDLGRHALKDFPTPRHLFQIEAPGLGHAFPPPRTLTARSHNLPASPTRFVGREDELLRVQQVLHTGRARLVSLTGGGGFGKSRLAIEAGWSLLSWFSEGVWFVPLAPITEEADLVPTINRALGIADDPDRQPIELLVEHLSGGPTLLVLDNLEQLGDAVVVVADLLARCPDLSVIATSRERLRLRGENEIAIAGLAFDDAKILFRERAAANDPVVYLDEPREAVAIDELVDRLDRIPLALELLAALVRDEAPSVLVTKLDRALELLTEGERDLPQRQRTLRSTIAWSHDLLEEDDRRLFDLLSLFAGGVPLPALRAVARGTGHDESDTALAARMDRLVQKSLVRAAEVRSADDPPRWWLLETIRQFAAERLDPGALDAGRAAHATWFATWTDEVSADASSDQGSRFDQLAREVDNLRLALHRGATHERIQLVLGLALFWEARGHWREGARWLDEIDLANAGGRARCRVLIARARLDRALVALHPAEARLREAYAVADDLGDEPLRSACAAELAAVVLDLAAEEGQQDELAIDVIHRPRERMSEARTLLECAVELAGDDDGARARASSLLAKLLLDEGETEQARSAATTAVDLHRIMGDRRAAAEALQVLASVELGLADHAAAAEHAATGIIEARSVGDRSLEGGLLWIQAIASAGLGRVQDAFELAETGYDAFIDAQDDASAAGICFVRGSLAQAAGDMEDARRWISRSAERWRAFGDERRASWCEDAMGQL